MKRKTKAPLSCILAVSLAFTSIIPAQITAAKTAPYVAVTKKLELNVGKSKTISVKGFYGAKVKKKVFKVKNKKIASVSKAGRVKGKKKGSTTIAVQVKYAAKGKIVSKKFSTKVKVAKASKETTTLSSSAPGMPTASARIGTTPSPVPSASILPTQSITNPSPVSSSGNTPKNTDIPSPANNTGNSPGVDMIQRTQVPGGNISPNPGTIPGDNIFPTPGGIPGEDTLPTPGQVTWPTTLPTQAPTAKPKPTILPDWSWVEEQDASQIGTLEFTDINTHKTASDGTYSEENVAESVYTYMSEGASVTETVKADEDATVGTLFSDGFAIDIPAGAFKDDADVTATVLGNGQLHISVDGDEGTYHALDEPATISFWIKESYGWEDIDRFRGIYKTVDEETGTEYEYYYIPDFDRLYNEGVISYEVSHFSDHMPGKLPDKEAYTYAAHALAVDQYTYNNGMQAELLQDTVDFVADQTMDALKITNDSTREKVKKALGRSGRIYTLARAAVNLSDGKEGAEGEMASAIADIVVNELIEDADKVPGMNMVTSTVGALPDVYKNLKQGDYEAANRTVLEAISSTNALYQYGKFCVEVVEASADLWVNANMEEMYKAYSGEPAMGAGRGGSESLEGDWDNLTTVYAGAFNGFYLQQLKAYCKKNGLTMNELTSDEKEIAKNLISRRLKAEFDARYAQDQKIKEQEKENLDLLDAFQKEGLLIRGEMNYDTKGNAMDRVNELFKVKASIEAMFTSQQLDPETVFNTNLFKPSQRTAYTNREFAKLVKIWMAASNKAEGRNSVQQYIEDNYNVMTLNQQGMTLFLRDTYQLKLRNMCKLEITQGIIWEASDPDTASVAEDGTVTGIWPGDVTITATYRGKQYTCPVTIADPVSLAPEEATLGEGDTLQLQLLGLSDEDGTPYWHSMDENVVKVTQDGTITGQTSDENSAYVYAELSDEYGRLRQFPCAVYTSQTMSVQPYSLALSIGEQHRLDLVDAAGNKVDSDWFSWDDKIATVSSNGEVIAKAAGDVRIQAVPKNGTSSSGLICFVTVTGEDPDHAYLNRKNLTLAINGTEKLYFTDPEGTRVTPASIRWYTSDANVASVDSDGTVTAKSVGTATITAEFTYNGQADEQSCTVTVIEDSGIKLDRSSIKLSPGQNDALSIVGTDGKDVYGASITWESSDSDVVFMLSGGQFKAQKEGTATVTAKVTKDGATTELSCMVSVYGYKLSHNQLSMAVGDTIEIYATDTNGEKVPFKYLKSSDLSIAEANSSGMITAKAAGTVTLTATVEVNYVTTELTCIATINEGSAQNYTLSKTSLSLEVGKTETLTVKDALGETVAVNSWTSTSTNIATVDSKGKVLAKNTGTTTITANVTKNNKSIDLTCTVKVIEAVTSNNKGYFSPGSSYTYRGTRYIANSNKTVNITLEVWGVRSAASEGWSEGNVYAYFYMHDDANNVIYGFWQEAEDGSIKGSDNLIMLFDNYMKVNTTGDFYFYEDGTFEWTQKKANGDLVAKTQGSRS